MLAFMARPGYQPMRLEALAAAIGATKADLRHLRKVIPGLLKAGAIAVRKRDLLMLPEGQTLPEGTILFRASGSARVVFNAEPGRPTGNVVTGRKGAFFIDFINALVITGLFTLLPNRLIGHALWSL